MKKSTATNQFTQGLVMDLNPLITPNNVLTDALNATIYTNNGNEGVLQNDMGNGRVETAFLPEGYIPVGSCEFGDIIYIASYNPLINKCQLGCFPSPQRNISSSSVSDLKQSLSSNDFQEIGEDKKPTGKIKANSVKKIVYKNNLTAGDKYIVCAEGISNNGGFLTDLGNTDHVKDEFPRLYKIKLISIEDDGKITELTNGLKWYSKDQAKDFFLKDCNINREGDTKPDINEWRSAVSSAYSIFSSKVSGKLAILAELESITGFSCTWGANVRKIENVNLDSVDDVMEISDDTTKSFNANEYDIYFLVNWETENNNINPKGIVLTKGDWINNPEIQTYAVNEDTATLEEAEIYTASTNIKVFPESGYYHTEFSRGYIPEDSEMTYEQFKTTYEYETYKKAEFNKIEQKQPFKQIVRSEDKYYINADRVEYENNQCKYYTLNDKNNPIEIYPQSINDDIVNNTFKYPIKKDFIPFTLPIEQIFSIEVEKPENKEITLDLITDVFDITKTDAKLKYKLIPSKEIMFATYDLSIVEKDNQIPQQKLTHIQPEGIIEFSNLVEETQYNLIVTGTMTFGNDIYAVEKEVLFITSASVEILHDVCIKINEHGTIKLLEGPTEHLINNTNVEKCSQVNENIKYTLKVQPDTNWLFEKCQESISGNTVNINESFCITTDSSYTAYFREITNDDIIKTLNIVGITAISESNTTNNRNYKFYAEIKNEGGLIYDKTINAQIGALYINNNEVLGGGTISVDSVSPNKVVYVPLIQQQYIEVSELLEAWMSCELHTNTAFNGEHQFIVPLTVTDEEPTNRSLKLKARSIEEVNAEHVESILPLDLSKCVYQYTIAPYMPYGILEQYAQTGTIDFSKIGKKSIKLNTWKYYNQSGYSTLTWGLEAYTEPDHVISEVVFEFYDNFGKAAAFHVSGKDSYNGVFTNYITFNSAGTLGLNSVGYNELGNYDDTSTIFYHRGTDLSKEELIPGKEYLTYSYDKNNRIITESHIVPVNGITDYDESKNYCENDAGILYSNKLYLVKIYINYSRNNLLGKGYEHVETRTDYRWFWTTTQFNELYTQLQDFKNAQFTLDLDPEMQIETTDAWNLQYEYDKYITDPNSITTINLKEPESFSAIQQLIVPPNDEGANMNLKVGATFQNTHNAFSLKLAKLNKDGVETNEEGIHSIYTNIYLGEQTTSNSPEQPTVKFSNKADTICDAIYPKNVVGGDTANNDETKRDDGEAFKPSTINLGSFDMKKKSFTNRFNLGFTSDKTLDKPIPYYNSNLEEKKADVGDKGILYNFYTEGQSLKFFGEHYSKYYFTTEKSQQNVNVLKSFIIDKNDLSPYQIDPNTETFTKFILIDMDDNSGKNTKYGFPLYTMNSSSLTTNVNSSQLEANINDGKGDRDSVSINEIWSTQGDLVKNTFPFIFPYVWNKRDRGGNWGAMKYDNKENGKVLGYANGIDSNSTKQESYNGSCACVDANGQINISDQVVEGRALVNKSEDISPYYYGRKVADLLKRSFYVDGTSSSLVYKPDNWIYLDNNYSQYHRDIIIKLESINKLTNPTYYNDNDCILFNGWDYKEYLNDINANYDSIDLEFESPNINLKLNSCQKTFPFIIQFQYIAPEMRYNQNKNVIVYALDEFKNIVSKKAKDINLIQNHIYCLYDDETFSELQGGKAISNRCMLSTDFASKVGVKNGIMCLLSPLTSTGTYNVYYTGIGRHIDNFPKGTLIFNK